MRNIICGIYRIHNNINNKDYIGQAIDIYQRWRQHKARYDNCAIHRAINKYGIDNFTFSILEECSEELLDEKEIYWINYYNSYFNGYNETSGGKRPIHTVCNRQIEMYDLDGNYIKDFPSMSAAARELKCEPSLINAVIQQRRPTAKGYQFKTKNDDTIVIKPFVKKKSGPSGKEVIQYDLKDNIIAEYISASEAARQTGLHAQNISGVCRGIKKTCGGYKWKYKNEQA